MVEIQEIDTNNIDWSAPNIRSVLDNTGALADSIQAHGQLEPGTGWWDQGRFIIATGHRRAEACKHLGRRFLARIVSPLSGTDLIEFQLIENIQAEALPPKDLERAVSQLVGAYGDQAAVGERIGKSRSWVSTILQAKEARESLADRPAERNGPQETAMLPSSSAAAFGALKDEENRRAAYREAVKRNDGKKEGLSGSLVREVVKEYKEHEIRDIPAYVYKLKEERAKLVKKRADIEAEIDRIDERITRLSKKAGL